MIRKVGVLFLLIAFVLAPSAGYADVGKIADTETQKEIKEIRAMFADLQKVVDQQNKQLQSANSTIASLRKEVAAKTGMPMMTTAPAVPSVGSGEITCGTGTKKLTIGGYAQFDYHAGDSAGTNTSTVNTFQIRRLYLDFKGTMTDNVDYRVLLQMPSTSGSSDVSALDAYVTLKNIDVSALMAGDIEGIYNPDARYLNLRLGQQTVPFGIEAPESSSKMTFVERSVMNTLANDGHELGLSAFGDFFDKRLAYSVGVYNSGDMNSSGTDSDDNKMVAARISAVPFEGELAGYESTIKVGTSASYEDVKGGSMPGVQYRSESARDTSAARFNGTDIRFGLDAEMNVGDFRLRAEWIRQLLNADGTGPGLDASNFDTFANEAFYVEPSFMVIPDKLRLAYRWDYLNGDEYAGGFADDVQTHTIGAEYWFTPYQSCKLNYAYMPNPANPDDKAKGEVLARYQICF